MSRAASFSSDLIITSAGNAEIKQLRSLHERKYRKQTGWFLAEGMRICTEAVELGFAPERLLYVAERQNEPRLKKLIAACEAAGGRAIPTTQDLLSRVSRKDNPQMVLAAFSQHYLPLDAVAPAPATCWVVLDRVRDPGNLGTIMRTADAVGAPGVILLDDCTDPYSVEAVRASMGAVFNVSLVQSTSDAFISFASQWPGQVIGTALPASEDYRIADWQGPCLLLMGNEQSGLTDKLMAACTSLVRMPMLGRSDSLNLAVSTGIALYEHLRHQT